MDLQDFLYEAKQLATLICTGEASAMDKLLLRDIITKCQIEYEQSRQCHDDYFN